MQAWRSYQSIPWRFMQLPALLLGSYRVCQLWFEITYLINTPPILFLPTLHKIRKPEFTKNPRSQHCLSLHFCIVFWMLTNRVPNFTLCNVFFSFVILCHAIRFSFIIFPILWPTGRRVFVFCQVLLSHLHMVGVLMNVRFINYEL